jgi:plasmid stabilization system protein ParE
MATVRFSRSARSDLPEIGAYTREIWRRAQAELYLSDLDQCSKMLAENPSLGRQCGWIRPRPELV